MRIAVHDAHVCVRLHSGTDWAPLATPTTTTATTDPSTPTPTPTPSTAAAAAAATPSSTPSAPHTGAGRAGSGGRGEDAQHTQRQAETVEMGLEGLSLVMELFPEDTVHAMRVAVLVQDVEIVDKVSKVGVCVYVYVCVR